MAIALEDRTATLTAEDLIASVCRDLENARAMGRIGPVADEDLTKAATTSVQSLWEQSRIKTFLPVLAARSAREQLQQASDSRHMLAVEPSTVETASISALAEELGGTIDVHLTYSPGETWHARLMVHRQEDEVPTTVRVMANGATMDQAMQGVAVKARDVLLS